MNRIIISFLVLASLIEGCSSPEESDKYKILKNQNDSLKLELNALQVKYDSVLQAINKMKRSNEKKPTLKSKPVSVLDKYQLELREYKTGYEFSYADRLFLPAISMSFRNLSNNAQAKRILVSLIFIDNTSGEQISTRFVELCDSYSPLLGGLTINVSIRSLKGWNILDNQNVSVKVYLNDELYRTFKIPNEEITL